MTKYPRTYHLPWSPGRTDDDKVLQNVNHFINKRVVVSLKKDGECTSIYRDHIHARSIDSKDHESRHWVKSLWAEKRWLIPEGWRVCGENCYAEHSIHYNNLDSYFMAFSIWNEQNECLSYDKTRELCDSWGFVHVPVIYDGVIGPDIKEVLDDVYKNFLGEEGYVVRLCSGFNYEDFYQSVAKFVRKDHVLTDAHWMSRKVVKNELRPA